MRAEIATIARKELGGFFASPAAFLFLGAFLGVTLFVFFWVGTFFARNLADVRPLFQWMPLLLIFLVAALTMRAWAEERRSGTLELLLTAPTSSTQLVLGKFLGALGLVAVALALTLPLPFTVAMLGPLDWGPVIGGYVAALALAAAYVSIGLWVSSRTDNQIVSLILTVAIAGAFYLVGSPAITSLFGHRGGELLRELGAGSRFDSITRGVLDLRDLYYYASITLAFLLLNRGSVESLRWAGNPEPAARARHRAWSLGAGLLAANVLVANAWLHHVSAARLDLTQGQAYTLSDATRDYLGQLREPLLIRGYFSASTHPLLAPLVPQIRDLMEEYAVAGGGRVRVEFIDPQRDPSAEEEAASRYGIKPEPFQTASRYQTSVVNAYFDILVSYGSEYQVLNFRDLIDVKAQGEGQVDVVLRNPEYDLTRTIRKVLTAYQGGGSPFDAIVRPLRLDAYLSAAATLPPELQTAREALEQALGPLRGAAGDKLSVHFADPGTDGNLATQLGTEQGLRPLIASLTDPRPFWFHLVLSDGQRREQVPLPQPFDTDGFRRSLEGAVKRFSPGFLKTVAVLAPEAPGQPDGFRPMGAQYGSLREALGTSVTWLDASLRDGRVPPNADMLLVLGPENLDERQRFAIDQFLMQGGSVVITSAPNTVTLAQQIETRPVVSGLEDWLAGHGLSVGRELVLDPISGALPIPVERPLGNGMTVREIQLAPYPYIVDVRDDGLDPNSPVTAGLGQVSVPWAAPVRVDAARQQGRRLTTLLRSSPDSWVSDSLAILPDYRSHPDLGFAPGSPRAAQTLAVMLEGRFESAFKGQPSPLLQVPPPAEGASAPPAPPPPTAADARVIEHSPDSARLVLIGAPSLFDDAALEMIGRALGSRYLKPAEFLQNIVDWSLEDQGLLGIRSRGQFARTLTPMPREAQAGWEGANYGAALAGLLLVWALHRWRRRGAARRHLAMLQGGAA